MRREGGMEGGFQSKNILPAALIVSASVLLVRSPRQAENTTENTHSVFPLTPFPLIKLPSQWLITGPDLGHVPCLLCNSCPTLLHFPLSNTPFPLQETDDNYINSLQLMIIIIKCDYRRKEEWPGQHGQLVFKRPKRANETRPTGYGTWPSHYTRTSCC